MSKRTKQADPKPTRWASRERTDNTDVTPDVAGQVANQVTADAGTAGDGGCSITVDVVCPGGN